MSPGSHPTRSATRSNNSQHCGGMASCIRTQSAGGSMVASGFFFVFFMKRLLYGLGSNAQ